MFRIKYVGFSENEENIHEEFSRYPQRSSGPSCRAASYGVAS